MSAARVVGRRTALAAIAGLALAPAACASRSSAAAIKVGSKDFTEELLLGEMYAQLLERAGYAVDRRLNLGSIEVVMAALSRGDVDVYPEYTGTALLVVLKAAPDGDPARVYATVKREYERRYRLTWLAPAPMNDSQALATTAAVASRFGLRTLSDLARQAPKLRLAAVPEFTDRPDGLAGLRKAYGGFQFASIRYIAIGLKYQALLDGDVDVAVAFSTDGQIDADHLVVLDDDKHFWPPYQVAPVVRDDALARFPKLKPALDALAPHVTDEAMRRMNWRVDGNHEEPADVARDFLTRAGLV
ncbi:MAG TPA: glycine betaine ABC transporter substrate-binding protein [Candidatus Eremiobacteraceae bacterium]|nr:glycine betaine ABC transporter substrate-binding protein [Candidatus Eremiobacteraceae bacterium]